MKKNNSHKLNIKKQKSHLKEKEKSLREILNKWDLIPGSPDDEYDCINHKLLSYLHNNKSISQKEISNILSYEIENHFELFSSKSEINKFSQIIYNWWENN